MAEKIKKTQRDPRFIEALIPIAVLIGSVIAIVKLFGDDAMSGGAQVSILLAAAVAVFISMVFCNVKWNNIENAITDNIKNISSALIMLFLIGAIGSTWMASGVVPTMIVYGLKILSPKIFLFATVIICAIISLLTGSSWTTIATFGVALISIGQSFGIPVAICAGAIISGAYFGDKLSPLSDTTIMASQTVGTPLFTHIRYMLITTTPTMIITLIIFLIIGFSIDIQPSSQTMELSGQIEGLFNISPWLLLVPVLTAVLIAMKLPTLITLFMASIFAIIPMCFAQPQLMGLLTGTSNPEGIEVTKTILQTIFSGSELNTGVAALDDLVSTSGMAGMLNTIWLILCAACFGGAMIGGKMINTITNTIIKYLRSTVAMVSATSFTGILCNICISDQYLSIILNSSLYKKFYEKEGYEPRLLSRTIEDSTTVTSVLVPWNTCGMTQSTVLGVATLSYLPYCFFNYLSPIMTVLITATGYKIKGIKRAKSLRK